MLLVIRAHSQTRFMNVTEYLKARGGNVTQVKFQGEAFNPEAVQRMSVKFLSNLSEVLRLEPTTDSKSVLER